MNTHVHQKVFSKERMQKYLDKHAPDQNKALLHYQINLKLSESLYPLLSIFEVALRNSLNRELTTLYGTPDWYSHIATVPGLKDIRREITIAQNHITKREEVITGSKVVAELTLGFWVRILNAEYDLTLWKSLRRGFPFLPKRERQRHTVSAPLNNIRNLRNRIYHNEPIAWNLDRLEAIYNELVMVLGWLNTELPDYAIQLSRFKELLRQARIDLSPLA